MKRIRPYVAAMLLAGVSPLGAQVGIEEYAPPFRLISTEGKLCQLADYPGKFVVLEWFNHDCPFVKKHYGSGNMQALQKEFTGQGVIWLSICSSAPGKQGNYPPPKQAELAKEKGAMATAILLDAKGVVGRQYGAKTTPHMFVISPEGKVIYQGAIDDQPSTDPADIPKAVNYVKNALDAALAGKDVEVKSTAPYGCSVKYP